MQSDLENDSVVNRQCGFSVFIYKKALHKILKSKVLCSYLLKKDLYNQVYLMIGFSHIILGLHVRCIKWKIYIC